MSDHVERPTPLAYGQTYCSCGSPWPCRRAGEDRETMKDYADRLKHEIGVELSLTPRMRKAIFSATERLANYVGSCPEGHRPLNPACPFCADEMAYEALLDAFPNTVTREKAPEGEHMPLSQVARKLQFNPGPMKVTRTPECVGCRKRAPWCSCGKADYR